MIREIHRALGPLTGTVRLPGDKSISHRSVLFAAMAEGTSQITGVLDSADVRSTIAAVSLLGAEVSVTPVGHGSVSCTVVGWGESGPKSGFHSIDCGNSGTTVRLLMGVLAGHPQVQVRFTGDESLSARPMKRVIEPLAKMGARFEDNDGCLPLVLHGAPLKAIDYTSPVASAQVKSAVLLAGMTSYGTTRVTEPAASRDHTERMLPAYGVDVIHDLAQNMASLTGPVVPQAASLAVPGDPSSAAFVITAALTVPESDVEIRDVALNPTRTGFMRVLERMGADVSARVKGSSGGEEIGDLLVRYTPGLRATTVKASEVPALIDEIPILSVLAAHAEGVTRLEGVGELRVKESDRLEAIRSSLQMMGVSVSVTGDVLEIEGPSRISGIDVDALGDHRLAMSWAVAGLLASDSDPNPMRIERFESVDVSYPGFVADMHLLGAW